MESVTYKVSDLRRLIAEESNQFKARIENGVESGNKSEAGKAYKEAQKRAKDFDGGGKEGYWKGDAKYTKEDYNGTTIDYNPENVDDKYKKRVHAQVKGYTSEAEMNNKEEKVGDFSDNENIYQGIKKAGQERHKKIKDLKKSGLQASKMPEGTFDKEEMYESKDGFDMRAMIDSLSKKSNSIHESAVSELDDERYAEKLMEMIDNGLVDATDEEACDKILNGEELENVPMNESKNSIKTVYFKKTQFINENHMRSRIPDDFKFEGCKFKMKDKANNVYLLEWKYGNAVILEHNNKVGMNESLDRMKQLMGYKSSDTETSKDIRLHEGSDNLNSTIQKVRKMMNENNNNE